MNPRLVLGLIGAVLIGSFASDTAAQTESTADRRFFHTGDGHIVLFGKKNGQAFAGRYRIADRLYAPEALKSICRVFDAPCESAETVLSLRLIEFLDFLQDRLAPEGRITITSGYRSPQYNQNLRRTGGLAAKASLHQYGMAADLILEGVPARHLWEYVKALGFGGTGYYHGQTVHIDVGPARSWDEATSGVGTGISDDNKLIGLVTDYDVYRPGEPVRMRFIRMTAFPIDVAVEFALARRDAANEVVEVLRFTPVVDAPGSGDCRRFADIDQMTAIRWRLPANLPAGRYHIRAGFCENPYEAMPAEIGSPEFVVNRNFGS